MADNQDEVETYISVVRPLIVGSTSNLGKFQLTVMKFDEDYQQACLHYTYEQMQALAKQIGDVIKSYEESELNNA